MIVPPRFSQLDQREPFHVIWYRFRLVPLAKTSKRFGPVEETAGSEVSCPPRLSHADHRDPVHHIWTRSSFLPFANTSMRFGPEQLQDLKSTCRQGLPIVTMRNHSNIYDKAHCRFLSRTHQDDCSPMKRQQEPKLIHHQDFPNRSIVTHSNIYDKAHCPFLSRTHQCGSVPRKQQQGPRLKRRRDFPQSIHWLPFQYLW